jgi:hypothetical protein
VYEGCDDTRSSTSGLNMMIEEEMELQWRRYVAVDLEANAER